MRPGAGMHDRMDGEADEHDAAEPRHPKFMPPIEPADGRHADNADQDQIGKEAADECCRDQCRQHRKGQQAGLGGEQRGQRRHRDRIGFRIGEAKGQAVQHGPADARGAHVFLRTALDGDGAPAEPEEIGPLIRPRISKNVEPMTVAPTMDTSASVDHTTSPARCPVRNAAADRRP